MFTVDDTCHPQRKEIYEKLDKLMEKIEDNGKYVYKLAFSGPKSCHSEKLAVAFGLMSLPSWMTVYHEEFTNLSGLSFADEIDI